MARSSETRVALPPWPRGYCVAERAAHALQHRRLKQEVPDLGRLASQDLLSKVVHDVTVVAGETGDEPADVGTTLQRQPRQLQGGDPALGALVEQRDVVIVEPQLHRAVEVGRGLLRGEAQVGRPNLDQLTTHPQLRHGQWRIDPGSKDQVQSGWQVLEKEQHLRVDRRRFHDVVVIEHQHQVARQSIEIDDQRRQGRIDRRRGRRQHLPVRCSRTRSPRSATPPPHSSRTTPGRCHLGPKTARRSRLRLLIQSQAIRSTASSFRNRPALTPPSAAFETRIRGDQPAVAAAPHRPAEPADGTCCVSSGPTTRCTPA